MVEHGWKTRRPEQSYGDVVKHGFVNRPCRVVGTASTVVATVVTWKEKKNKNFCRYNKRSTATSRRVGGTLELSSGVDVFHVHGCVFLSATAVFQRDTVRDNRDHPATAKNTTMRAKEKKKATGNDPTDTRRVREKL